MKNFLKKLKRLFLNTPIEESFKWAYMRFLSILKYRELRKLTDQSKNADEIFGWIYHTNYWGFKESRSGNGSSLKYTENIRKKLPAVFRDYSIYSVLDVPCGDFNWMRRFLNDNENIKYIGGDIVNSIIEENIDKYASSNITFKKIDITKDNLPFADVILTRDCLFHLSYNDIFLFLKNYIYSNIPYIITTTHKNNNLFNNLDIKTGDFRLLDLRSLPFTFPEPLISMDDWLSPDPERYLCLWTRSQILEAIDKAI